MDSLWPSLAAELKKELPAQQYDTWIKPLRAERQVVVAVALVEPPWFVDQPSFFL